MTHRPNRVVYAAKSKKLKGSIVCGDATEFLRRLPSNCARVVFLDPPFNLGKQYDKSKKLDHRPEKEYRQWLTEVTSEAARVLEPGGSLFLYHIPLWAMRVGDSLDETLTFRQWIAVSMKKRVCPRQPFVPRTLCALNVRQRDNQEVCSSRDRAPGVQNLRRTSKRLWRLSTYNSAQGHQSKRHLGRP